MQHLRRRIPATAQPSLDVEHAAEIAGHDGRELAEAIASYLPDVPVKTLAACCNEYQRSRIWNANPVQQRAGLEWLRDAMLGCNAIRTKFAYEDLADMRFAEQVIRESPP